MKFKKIFPYFLAFTTCLCSDTGSSNTPINQTTPIIRFTPQFETNYDFEMPYATRQEIVSRKTGSLMNIYMNNVLSGIDSIKTTFKNTQDKYKAVKQELPGAPRNENGWAYCLFAPTTQLNRALQQNGDTIQIVPTKYNAHQASSSFRDQMSKTYSDPKYAGALHSGHLYSTNKEYNRDLERYLRHNMRGKKGDTDSLRNELIQNFAKNHFPASILTPGSIIIVDIGHAIVYLGMGRIENGAFISEPNNPKSQAICCAYNVEYSAIELKTWTTHNAFVAEIEKIYALKKDDELLHNKSYKLRQYSKTLQMTLCPDKDNTRVIPKYYPDSFSEQDTNTVHQNDILLKMQELKKTISDYKIAKNKDINQH